MTITSLQMVLENHGPDRSLPSKKLLALQNAILGALHGTSDSPRNHVAMVPAWTHGRGRKNTQTEKSPRFSFHPSHYQTHKDEVTRPVLYTITSASR
jgi:hypothetical protein